MIEIKEVIVVEGENDRRAVLQSVLADVVVTKGHALKEELIQQLKVLQNQRGLIILTDPDYTGRLIRRRLSEQLPGVKHAHISREEAIKKGDIGIENVNPQAILRALQSISTPKRNPSTDLEINDLYRLGLNGRANSSNLRRLLCQELSLEFGSSKNLFRQFKLFGLNKADIVGALQRIENRFEKNI